MARPPPRIDERHIWFLQRVVYAWWVSGRPPVQIPERGWWRSHSDNVSVGGVFNSWHLDGLALDVDGATEQMVQAGKSLGLQVVPTGDESDEWHFEPPWRRASVRSA